MITKQMLIYVIKNKDCFQSSNCEKIWGQAYRRDCPLLNKFCTYAWEVPVIAPGEPKHEVRRHPEFVQKAVEMFIEVYGEEELFNAIL